MNKKINKVQIPLGINLNIMNNDKNESKSLFIKQLPNNEEELEKYIFDEILLNIPRIDYNFLAYEDLTDIRGSIIRMLNQDEDFKILSGSKSFKEEECIVIIIELFNHVTEQLNLDFMYDLDTNYFFNGKYWQILEKNTLTNLLRLVAEKTGMLQTRTKQKKVKDQLLEQFTTTFSRVGRQASTSKITINLLNGTFNFNNNYKSNEDIIGTLKAHDKNDFLKYQLPFEYDANADCPIFMKYLNHVLPDPTAQNVLFEYMGYVFSPLKLEKTCILYGSGSNGKSVFFEVIRALLGEANVSYIPMDKLLDENGYYRIRLHTKLLNYASELGRMKDIDMFKRITSQEPITARSLYKDFIEIDGYCKFMFNANTLPRVEQTEAFFRRQLIIPFNVTIKDDEKDVELHKKIIENELGGIFNLILKGLGTLTIAKKFSKSQLIEEQLSIYKRESNNVHLFMSEEGYTFSAKEKIPLGVFYEQYKNFCFQNGYRSLNSGNFSERLRNLNYEVRRSNGGSTFVFCKKDIFPNDEKMNEFLKND